MTNGKFHIRCDMEGVTGVVDLAQVTPGTPEYTEARSWFMAELVALIEGLAEGGASEISVYDEHWFGRNVDLAQIPSGVRVYCGKPPYRADWAGGLEAGQTGMVMCGFHSMAGTGQTLCHTYESDIRALTINGLAIGEIGMETAIAGDWDVPLALIVADSGGVREAQKLIPGVAAVTTKISHSYGGAECFSLADVCQQIRKAAAALPRQKRLPAPLKIQGPVEFQCELNSGAFLEELRRSAPQQFIKPNVIGLTGGSATAVWAEYWRLKLDAQSRLM